MSDSRSALLARSWDAAAALYTSELAPRFLPWVHDAINRVQRHSQELPSPGEKTILVPCCGPGLEIPLLGQAVRYAYPILGIDLSGGMVAVANQVIEEHWKSCGATTPEEAGASNPPKPNMSAMVGDAMNLQSTVGGAAAVIFSSFGLQQLGPKAPEALASWVRCLAPGGLAVVLMWPSACESRGPWHAYDVAVRLHQRQNQDMSEAIQSSRSKGPEAWESQLAEAALQVPGVILLEDSLVQHKICWPDLETLWTVMTQGGPWHARRLVFGDAHMEELKALLQEVLEASEPLEARPAAVTQQQQDFEWCTDVQHTEQRQGAGQRSAPLTSNIWRRPLMHRPTARLLVFQKLPTPIRGPIPRVKL